MLLQKLREESRAVFLQRKSRELLDNEELQVKDITGSSGTLKNHIIYTNLSSVSVFDQTSVVPKYNWSDADPVTFLF